MTTFIIVYSAIALIMMVCCIVHGIWWKTSRSVMIRSTLSMLVWPWWVLCLLWYALDGAKYEWKKRKQLRYYKEG